MKENFIVYVSQSLDSRHNQAIESTLMSMAKSCLKGFFILYLWSNENTVFIGKNQNAYLECDINLLEGDGGFLRRRLTGGGAVFHDAGNLNFTFIGANDKTDKSGYDTKRQFDIVIDALKSLGINAVLSGRNDMTVDGRKFSGNAFYKDSQIGMHHGTILIKSDYQKISKYLTAGKIKLRSNQVESVAARVINLSDIDNTIDKDKISSQLILMTQKHIGKNPRFLKEEELDKEQYQYWYQFLSESKRLYGDNIFYDARIEHRFDWGTADIRLKLSGDKIVGARIYSDCLDTELIEKKEELLIGKSIHQSDDKEIKEILELL